MSIRFGIIGCGAIGQRRHIPECDSNPHTTIAALCDVNASRVRQIAEKYSVSGVYTDYREMLKREKLDAVVVGTPNAFHAEQSIAALKAGCHVLVEKPMASTLKEARAMMDAAKAAKKFLMVGQNQRLALQHIKARHILASGVLGRPLAFETTFKHPGPDAWSVDGPSSWFFRKAEAIMGVCGDLGVHKIDLMRYLLGQEFVQVQAVMSTIDKTYPNSTKKIDVEDNAFLNVVSDQGVLGSITISWTNYGKMENNGTTIYCQNGVMTMGIDTEYSLVIHHRDGTKEFHKVGKMATNEKQTGSGIMDMFVAGIRAGKAPPIDGAEGYRSLEVILGAFESVKTGKTIKLKGL